MVESLIGRRCRVHRRSQPSVCKTGHPHSSTARAAGPNEPRTEDSDDRLAAHIGLTNRTGNGSKETIPVGTTLV
ncbi:uncharacterized protein ACO6RY_01133 [Pungitius sinensis]